MNRKIHNKYAKLLMPEMSYKEIDEINKEIDKEEYLKKYGRYHRKYWGHDKSALTKSSLAINHGDAKREKVRKIHLLLDYNNDVKRMIIKKELLNKMRKYK